MTKTKKIGIILIIVGLCLPTATLPFISEFLPLPDVCLTSNFFHNMGNMEIVFRPEKGDAAGTNYKAKIAIPYRYVFAFGIVLMFTGIGVITLSGNNKGKSKP